MRVGEQEVHSRAVVAVELIHFASGISRAQVAARVSEYHPGRVFEPRIAHSVIGQREKRRPRDRSTPGGDAQGIGSFAGRDRLRRAVCDAGDADIAIAEKDPVAIDPGVARAVHADVIRRGHLADILNRRTARITGHRRPYKRAGV